MRQEPVRVGSVVLALLAVVVARGGATGSSSAQAGPDDRYALAGGCYGVESLATGDLLTREADGFAATAESAGQAEPFRFQATDLGRYLLFASRGDFLAASDGVVGEVADAVTGSVPGGVTNGLTGGATDAAADALARGPLGEATGRGSAVVSASAPSELADWEVEQVDEGTFTIRLPALGRFLAADGGGLLLVDDADERARFGFRSAQGCAAFPEIEVNVEGPVPGGATPFTEVRGFLDAHLHLLAFEFLGGRVRCGRPWHRFGVTHALVDCPDHEPNGLGAALEQVLSGVGPHDTHGWPTFAGWPRWEHYTHEQVYYRWLERAWRGGLRLMVSLLVDNHALCSVYPYRSHGCNEMDGVRLQAQRARELERYIDAQSGGPGEGWFRIVTDPFQARRVMNEGKLAVLLGIEVSTPLDCGLTVELPSCDTAQIDRQLDEMYALGVRQMELANKFDNALTGVTGDAGATGVIVNGANALETGRFWQLETCPDEAHGHDRAQYNVHDESGAPDELTGRDAIFGGVLRAIGSTGAAPIYPEGPHCNVRGLSDLGEHAVNGLIERGIIFDPDHMSAYARHQALDIVEDAGYSGVISSHSWADDTIYRRVWRLGGVVTPYGGRSRGFVESWRSNREWADPRFLFGLGYGSDVNGFGGFAGPPWPGAESPRVPYPFAGFGGGIVDRQRSGERVYDINVDGGAHYGLIPDWIEDLRMLAGDEIVEDMTRGPEAYLQMWERALGIAGDACRPDVPDLRDEQVDALQEGMTPEDVLWALGQPRAREGAVFRYCMTASRTATVTFTADGSLVNVEVN